MAFYDGAVHDVIIFVGHISLAIIGDDYQVDYENEYQLIVKLMLSCDKRPLFVPPVFDKFRDRSVEKSDMNFITPVLAVHRNSRQIYVYSGVNSKPRP